jgi:peptidyl-prolyl cis-trans isomerase B (cyclophilin B)
MNSRLIWCWALLALLTLGGCGGGKKSAAFSVNTTANVVKGGFNASTEFAITGSGLRNALIVPSLGCDDDLEEVGRVDNTVRLICTTNNVEVRFTVVDAVSGEATVVVATLERPSVPYTITAITPGTSAKLGATSEFTVTGNNLYSGVVRIDAEGCGNVTTTDVSEEEIPRILKISCVLNSSTPKFKVIGLDTDAQIGSNFEADFLDLEVVNQKAEAAAISVNGVENTYTIRGYFFEATNATVTSSKCTNINTVEFNAAAAAIRFKCTPNGDLDTTFEVLNQDNELLAQVPLPIRIFFAFALGDSTTVSYRVDVDLDYENAPNTVTNFLKYVDQEDNGQFDSYFTNTLIHRMEKSTGFSLIQGGAYASRDDFPVLDADGELVEPGTPKVVEGKFPLAPIPLETSALTHVKGTIAMARTKDPDSAASQFFFNVTDNSNALSPSSSSTGTGYAVFGKVVDDASQTDLEAILSRPLTTNSNVPVDNIRIINVARSM